jgi:LmbE family N-acetylglucosaminyl deacetylase
MKAILRRGVRKLARRVVFPTVEGIWAAGFALAGLVFRPSLQVIAPAGRDRVLVIAPHADDETLGCGLAIGAHVDAGDHVTVAVVTDGRRSRAGRLGPEAMRLQRQAEARCAMDALGAQVLLQDLREGEWSRADLADALDLLLDQARPTVVYAPSTVDYHPEHARVALALADALARINRTDVEIRLYEVQVPLAPTLANSCVVRDQNARARKYRALACYTSQRRSFGWMARRDRYNSLLYRQPGPVEVFASMSCKSYAALTHTAAGRHYRGIRPRPFTDPLAWLVGIHARQRAVRLANIRHQQN